MAALPDNFATLLLGSAVAGSSVLLAVSSLWTVVRRNRAEEHFLTVLAGRMRKTFAQDKKVLERAKEGKLTEKEKEDLRRIVFEALSELEETTEKNSIERALNQPSPTGRKNFQRRILSEAARRALQAPEKSDAVNDAAQQDQDVAGQATDQAGQVAGEVEATDAARREARERGVDLTKVGGTGSDGRIILSDVVKAAESMEDEDGAASEAAQQVQDTVDQVQDVAEQVADQAGQVAGQVQDTAGQATQQVQDTTGQEATGGAARQPQEAPTSATRTDQGAAHRIMLSVLKLNDPDGIERLLSADNGNLPSVLRLGRLKLKSMAKVSWPEGNTKPIIESSRVLGYHTAEDEAGWGAFWGFLFGLIFFVPFLGEPIEARMGGLSDSLADVGIDADFIAKVREMITEGTSALFLLTSGQIVLNEVFEELSHLGVVNQYEIITTILLEEQESQLREAFLY